MSQNSFLLKSPTLLSPNLFDILMHPNLSDRSGCSAPWPPSCTNRTPPSLRLLTHALLCFPSAVSLVLFSSPNLASPVKSVFRALSLLFSVLSSSLLGCSYHSHGAQAQNSTLVFHRIYLTGVFLLGVPQTPPSDSTARAGSAPSPYKLVLVSPTGTDSPEGRLHCHFLRVTFPGLFTIGSLPRSCPMCACTHYSFL